MRKQNTGDKPVQNLSLSNNQSNNGMLPTSQSHKTMYKPKLSSLCKIKTGIENGSLVPNSPSFMSFKAQLFKRSKFTNSYHSKPVYNPSVKETALKKGVQEQINKNFENNKLANIIYSKAAKLNVNFCENSKVKSEKNHFQYRNGFRHGITLNTQNGFDHDRAETISIVPSASCTAGVNSFNTSKPSIIKDINISSPSLSNNTSSSASQTFSKDIQIPSPSLRINTCSLLNHIGTDIPLSSPSRINTCTSVNDVQSVSVISSDKPFHKHEHDTNCPSIYNGNENCHCNSLMKYSAEQSRESELRPLIFKDNLIYNWKHVKLKQSLEVDMKKTNLDSDCLSSTLALCSDVSINNCLQELDSGNGVVCCSSDDDIFEADYYVLESSKRLTCVPQFTEYNGKSSEILTNALMDSIEKNIELKVEGNDPSLACQPKKMRSSPNIKKQILSTSSEESCDRAVGGYFSCQWHDCTKRYHCIEKLTKHVKHEHIHPASKNDVFVCLWHNCKFSNQPSCSYKWLSKHVLRHCDMKPFKCVIFGCDMAFVTGSKTLYLLK